MGVPENGTNVSHTHAHVPEYLTEPYGLMVGRLSFEVTIALMGLFGNIMVCVVIAKRMRRKSAINYYLFNLAIADIGVVLIIFPMAVLLEQESNRWPLGKFVCLYVYPFIDTFYGASIWFIAAVAIERYINIVRVFKIYQSSCSLITRGRFVVCVVWLISFMVVSLPLFFVIDFQEAESLCYVNWFRESNLQTWKEVYTVTLVVFCFLLPLSIISWTYIKIARQLEKSSEFHRSLTTKEKGLTRKKTENARLKENAKARKILTPIVVAFVVTMLPINLFRLVTVYWQGMYHLNCFWVLYNVLIIFTTANSASNPLIYTIVSREFRRGFVKMLFRSRQRLKSFTVRSRSSPDAAPHFERTRFFPERWPKLHTLRETVL